MTTPTYRNVHNKFKLNGAQLNAEDLCRVAYCFIKEGEEFEKPVGNFILDWFDENDYIDMNTSGSTGVPKQIRVKKQAMVNSAIATGNYFELSPGDRVLNCLPVKYVAGKMMFVRSFILGLDMEFVAPSANPMDKNEYQFDFSAMVPLQAQNSLKHLKDIKKLIVGGAKINAQLEKELLKSKTQCFETFGMTETVSHMAAKKIGETAFTIFPNIQVTQDNRNCMLIKVPDISDKTIVTNDLIELVSENQFKFLGRIDNMINSAGVKLIPELIEAKLAPYISQRFFMIGQADNLLGEKLVLVVEGKKFEVDNSIFDVLDKYEKPKEIVFRETFKETNNGKIIRKESF